MTKAELCAPLLNPASILWAAITLSAMLLAAPIIDGWLHDPSLSFAFTTFLLWLLATVLQWRRFPAVWSISKLTLAVLATALLCLGIVGELQAFIYMATVILFSLPIAGSVLKKLCFILLACLWMPALTWLLLPYLGYMLQWIALFITVLLLIYSLSLAIIRHASKTGHTTT